MYATDLPPAQKFPVIKPQSTHGYEVGAPGGGAQRICIPTLMITPRDIAEVLHKTIEGFQLELNIYNNWINIDQCTENVAALQQLYNATCGFIGWNEAEHTRAWRKRRKALKVRKKMHRVRHLDQRRGDRSPNEMNMKRHKFQGLDMTFCHQ